MIYTVTFNPSLDYIVQVDEFQTGLVNRTSKEQMLPGGKGINVSIVLNNLGIETVALGFVAGFTGKEIEKRVQDYGCRTDFLAIDEGYSRINLKLRSKEETEINGQGPSIQEKDIDRLYEKLDRMTENDVLVLAGSIPSSMPNTIYEQILERLAPKKIKIIVDATGDLLVRVLKYHPFLIKPNNHELSEIFATKIQTKEEVSVYAKKLKDKGARNVMVSMAGEGAVLLDVNGQLHQSPAPKGTVINSVGAGDSMVAGFIKGYIESGDYEKAFLMGIATGSASAFSTQLATKPEVLEIYRRLKDNK